MQVTCLHSSSKGGIPVILDNNGEVMGYPEGLTAVLNHLGATREQAARAAGYRSARSVEKFWQGTVPSARLLNWLGQVCHILNAFDNLGRLESLTERHPDLATPEVLEEINQMREVASWLQPEK